MKSAVLSPAEDGNWLLTTTRIIRGDELSAVVHELLSKGDDSEASLRSLRYACDGRRPPTARTVEHGGTGGPVHQGPRSIGASCDSYPQSASCSPDHPGTVLAQSGLGKSEHSEVDELQGDRGQAVSGRLGDEQQEALPGNRL